jgi:hypothetical protein
MDNTLKMNNRIKIIRDGLRKMVMSDDPDFHVFYLKLYPFLSTDNIFRVCINKYIITCNNYDLKSKMTRNRIIHFLINGYKNDMLDKTKFDEYAVRSNMFEYEQPELIEELVKLGTSSSINEMSELFDSTATNFNLMTVDSKKLAEKMTLICSSYHNRIKSYQLVNYVRNASNKPEASKIDIIDDLYYINKLIYIFDRVAYWVPTTILKHPIKKHQEKLIKKFVEIVEECRKLNNYHIVMAIIAGLNNVSITRLKFLWNKQKYIKKINVLNELMSPQGNYKNYRSELEDRLLTDDTPSVPYLGMIVSDYQHMLESDPVDEENNCFKRDILESIVVMVNRFMKTQREYDITDNPNINVNFDKLFVWTNDKLYSTSVDIYSSNRTSLNATKGSVSTDNLSRRKKRTVRLSSDQDELPGLPGLPKSVPPRRMHSSVLDISQTYGSELPPPVTPRSNTTGPMRRNNPRPRSRSTTIDTVANANARVPRRIHLTQSVRVLPTLNNDRV